MKNKPKVIVILGQTATGKSDLGVYLAKKFNGEIISADSRQVYKDLNIGSGKITKAEMKGVSHHLLDVVAPKSTFTVTQFKKKAQKAIGDILKRGKLPIIVGGTAFYIDALIYDFNFPEVKANKELRKKLEKVETSKLYEKLKKADPDRASNIDPMNKVRIIRSLEIVESLGKVPEISKNSPYDVLTIGLKWPQDELNKRIHDRLHKRMRSGMLAEVKRLHQNGLSYKRMERLGLEYRYLAYLLQNKMTKEEMLERLEFEIRHFAKRQMTWFKKDKKTIWFKPTEKTKVVNSVKKFLRS